MTDHFKNEEKRHRLVQEHSLVAATTLAEVLESTSDCIIALDRKWRITFLNKRAAAELLPTENLVGRHLLEIYPKLVETPFWATYQQVMADREAKRVESYMPGLDSWYEAYAAPIDDGITVFFRNIDSRRRAEEALWERETQFRKTLDHIPQMVWSALPDGSHDYYSRLWYEFTGIPAGTTDGEVWKGVRHLEDQELTFATWHHSLATGGPYEIEYRLRHHSGEYRWVLGRAWPERNTDGEIVRWYGTCTDIHDRVCAQQTLQEAQALQQSVLDSSADCIKILSRDGSIEFMNKPGLCAMELKCFEHVQGKQWVSFWPTALRKPAKAALNKALSGRPSHFTGCCPTATGAPKWWDVVITPMFGEAGDITRLLSISRDITSLREASEQVKWASEHDALTSLPNRRLFEAHLQAASFRVMQESGVGLGILLIDLDHFKHVNDTLGHPAGDHLLKTFASRLKGSVRPEDFVARLGGDEFAIIIKQIGDEKDLVRIGASILARLQTPVQFGGRVICGSASIGGALFPRDGSTAEELLKNADTALYALKSSGRGGTKMFHGHMREESQRIASQLNVARMAVNEKSVIPHYQPKVDLKTGNIAGFEALLRWQHPTRGLQEPDSVAEAFKDFELASKIGEVMQNKVFDDIVSWRRSGIEFGSVSINAAPVEFLRDDFAERLLSRLEERQLPPGLVELEVTEHVFIERGSEFVERALGKLSEAGIRISLDDFGTGYSSLSHLRDFPVDVVKIDRTFVAQMANDEETASIVLAVINLANSLTIEVVAEGIETIDQMNLLKLAGCTFGQGWLFGRPVCSDEILPLTSRAA